MTNAYANQQREREKLRLANVGDRISVRGNDNAGAGVAFQSTLMTDASSLVSNFAAARRPGLIL